jgi:hypothetical protein
MLSFAALRRSHLRRRSMAALDSANDGFAFILQFVALSAPSRHRGARLEKQRGASSLFARRGPHFGIAFAPASPCSHLTSRCRPVSHPFLRPNQAGHVGQLQRSGSNGAIAHGSLPDVEGFVFNFNIKGRSPLWPQPTRLADCLSHRHVPASLCRTRT